MPRPILFVDRDGTLCQEPHDLKVDALDKILLVEDVIPSLLRIKNAGFYFVMVTNQDGLGTASYPRQGFDICQNFLVELFRSQGISFEVVLICSHYTYELCSCRKPNTGTIERLLNAQDWDRSRSAMVGDREGDMEFAKQLSVRGLRMQSPFGPGLSWVSIADALLKL